MGVQEGAANTHASCPLEAAPVLQERQRPARHWSRLRLLICAVAVVAISALTWAAVRALTSSSPDLAYPGDPAAPAFAMVVVRDQSWDDDDPMRSRQVVLDIKARSTSDLLGFYRTAYPSSAGWRSISALPTHELCLVNTSVDGFTDIVEVLTYRGARVPHSRARHLVMISRMQDVGPDACGAAHPWIDSDLL